MSVILIDEFGYNDGTRDIVITVAFNNSTAALTYTAEPSTPIAVLNEEQRGRSDGDPIGRIYSDDYLTYYDIVASFAPAYAVVSDSGPVAPNPPQCDITLSVVTTDELSQGAHDGTATLTGNTSFLPTTYSLNGVDFTGQTVYNNLAPGNYLAYAKDQNGCTATIQFYIEAFDNPIDGGFDSGLPQKTVSPGNVSRWNAAFNPVVLNFFIAPDPAKTNPRIEIEITSQKGTVTGSWYPGINGKARCDISAYLQGLVNAKDDFKYDVLNYRDLNRAASFTIRYRQLWDEGTGNWYTAPQPLYVTYSAMQLGDPYGGNMAQYVPFLNEPNPNYKAKFLTLFSEPTAWVGLPFDISFIFSEYLITEEVKLRTSSLDINRNPIGLNSINSFLLNNDSGYILGSDLGRLIIQQGALPPVQNDGIFEQLGINRLMLAGLPGQLVEYFKIQLYTGTDENPNFVTQPQIIKINRQCNDPYVYLKWLNTLGGWDYWRFGFDQIMSLSTSDGVVVDRNVFDWANDETISDTISKSVVERITIGANVSALKVSGLKGLHASTKIQMLVQNNPYKWHTVTLATGSFEIGRSKGKTSQLKFTIDLPEINIQRQ